MIRQILTAIMLLAISSSALGLNLVIENPAGGDDEVTVFRKVDEGETFRFDVVVTDNNAPIQTVTAYHMPKGASFNGINFQWTPADDQAGIYEISFSTYDPSTQDDVFKTIRILVADTSFEINAGETFTRLFTSYDPDGDKVEITATGLPAGATFTGSKFNPKLFEWTPDNKLAGRFAFTITATDYPPDGTPQTDASIIIIKVTKKGGPDREVTNNKKVSTDRDEEPLSPNLKRS